MQTLTTQQGANMLYNVGEMFAAKVEELARRCRIEKQAEGWAVIIDGEVWTWAVSERRAYDIGAALLA
jgi:hypothetical protein